MQAANHAFVAPIVEGHGEQEALPTLLQRLVRFSHAGRTLKVNPPIRVKSGSFLNDRLYFEKYVGLAATKAAQEAGSVLILLDCDVGLAGAQAACPADLGPELLMRARAVRPDVQFFVALANREYEAWFVAAVSSLQAFGGMPEEVQSPPDPESIRDAKGWLGRMMVDGYDPIIHQLDFTRRFDMTQAMSCPSFRRLHRIIQEIAS